MGYEALQGYLKQADFGTPESGSTERVSLTIDGRAVRVPAGTSVIRAAAFVDEAHPDDRAALSPVVAAAVARL